jgi:outer membrane lipoprotein SlyB
MKVAWTLVLLLLLAACNSTSSGGGQHATVQLRDGSSVTGTLVSSSADEIKITGDDNVTRTLPMSQVRSVEYGDAPAASAAGSSAAPTMAGSSRPAAKAPSRPRPTLDDVTTDTHVVPSGTEVSVQTEETIDGSTAADGQTFAATVTEPVKDADGKVVIPSGAKAQVVIRSLTQGGKIRGRDDLVLDLASVSIDGRQYALSTADLEEKGKQGLGANKRTAEFVGGGAAIGGIVGAIFGGGKGAAIGAGIGSGGGVATQAITKGNIHVEAETILTFKLDKQLRVVQRRRD